MQELPVVLKRSELDDARSIDRNGDFSMRTGPAPRSHKRIRDRSKHVRRSGARRPRSVAKRRRAARCSPKGGKDRLDAERHVEEAASGGVQRLAEVALEQADRLKADVALAEEGGGPARSRSASRPGRSPAQGRDRRSRRSRRNRSAIIPVSRKERAARRSAIAVRWRAPRSDRLQGVGAAHAETVSGSDIDGIREERYWCSSPSATIDTSCPRRVRRPEPMRGCGRRLHPDRSRDADPATFGSASRMSTVGCMRSATPGCRSRSSRSRRRSSTHC